MPEENIIVITAAGMGTRLRPFTSNIPKALVEIDGKPILEHQLRVLETKKIDHLIVVLGYKSLLIRDYIDKRMSNYKVTYVENSDYQSTGCGWSLMKALEKIHDGFIYINCDLLFSKKNYESLFLKRYTNVILVRSLSKTKETILQKIEAINGKVIRMDLTLSGKYQYEAVGPVKIDANGYKSLCAVFNSLDNSIQKKIRCYTLLGLFAKINPLYINLISDKSWAEVNTAEDRIEAEKIIKVL